MKNIIHLSMTVTIALSLVLSNRSVVHADSPAGSVGQASACNKCPRCRETCCELKVEQGEKEKHCWNVECETICIPRVVFPWQKSCCDPRVNNGAWTRTVRVLKKHTYTCPTCEYSWSPVDRGCCGVGCCHPRCLACGGLPIEMGIAASKPAVPPLPPVPSPDGSAVREPTSHETRSPAEDTPGFIQHHTVKVVSFVSRILSKESAR